MRFVGLSSAPFLLLISSLSICALNVNFDRFFKRGKSSSLEPVSEIDELLESVVCLSFSSPSFLLLSLLNII